MGLFTLRNPFRKRPKTWREELAEEKKQRRKEEKKATAKKLKEEMRERKRQKREEKRKKKRAPKVGRNGMTWAEKEATKKELDSPKRKDLDHESWSGKVYKHNGKFSLRTWQKQFIVIQGHFLYVFPADKPNARCKRVLLLKKAEVTLKGMKDGRYYIVRIFPKTPRRPFVNKSRPSKKLLNGALMVACVNTKVQEGLAREIKRCSKMKHGGRSDAKVRPDQALDLGSASTGGLKTEKHVVKWRKMFENPPSLGDLGMVDKADWLDREGKLSNPWVRRYIVLKGHWLYEFKDTMPSCRAQRVVFLGNAKVTPNKFANNGFTINSLFQRNPNKIGNEDKQYSLQCGTLEMRKQWEDIITRHATMRHAGKSKRLEPKPAMDEDLPPVMNLFQYAI